MALYKVSYEIKKNDLPKISNRLSSEIKDVQQATCLMLVQAAAPNTPVGETGNLKNNINIGQDSVHWLAPYAGFVHNGTKYMAARPFIVQAVAQVWPIYQKAIATLIKGS